MDLEPSIPTILAIVVTLTLMYLWYTKSGGQLTAIDEKAEEKLAPKTEPEKSKTIIEKTGTRLEAFRKFLSTKEGTGVLALLLWVALYYLGRGYFSDTQVGRAIYASSSFFWLTSLVAFISGYLGSIEKHKIANHVARGIWALPVIYLLFVIPTNTGPGLATIVQSQIDSATTDRQSTTLPIVAVDRTPRGGEAWELTLPTTTWTRILRGQDLELCFEPFRGGAARIRASNGQEVTVSPGQAAVLPAGHWIDVISVDPRNPSVFKYWWVIGSCRPNRNI